MDKISATRIGLGMCGLGVSDSTAEIIVRVQESLEKMGGSFSLSDAIEIESEVMKKHSTKLIEGNSIQEIIDRFSKDPEKSQISEVLDSLRNLLGEM